MSDTFLGYIGNFIKNVIGVPISPPVVSQWPTPAALNSTQNSKESWGPTWHRFEDGEGINVATTSSLESSGKGVGKFVPPDIVQAEPIGFEPAPPPPTGAPPLSSFAGYQNAQRAARDMGSAHLAPESKPWYSGSSVVEESTVGKFIPSAKKQRNAVIGAMGLYGLSKAYSAVGSAIDRQVQDQGETTVMPKRKQVEVVPPEVTLPELKNGTWQMSPARQDGALKALPFLAGMGAVYYLYTKG